MSKAKTKSTKPKAAKAVKPAKVKGAPPITDVNTVIMTKPAKVERVVKNDIAQPGQGTACRAIWEVLDKLHADDKDITFPMLLEATDSKSAKATVRTQWARWRQFNGLKRAQKDA